MTVEICMRIALGLHLNCKGSVFCLVANVPSILEQAGH